ncbi:hypothetical protein METY_0406 [Methylopila sp. Yamaguchi]|nr:hypothetical protein METY_0406 [Methylopila sp. Yamaguchi]
MARVVAALEADDDVRLLREPIDDLALAFVAPLGADHDDVRHLAKILPPDRPRAKKDPGSGEPGFSRGLLSDRGRRGKAEGRNVAAALAARRSKACV